LIRQATLQRKAETRIKSGLGMHWYVYPLAAFASVFLGHFLVDQVGQPIRSVLRLRRIALTRMTLFRKVALPRPRELAITSQAIHEHELAVRNLRGAMAAFYNLGTRLLAIGEGEPAVRIVMSLLGLNVVQAGRALIALSRICATAGIDSDENRRAIGRALHTSGIALGAVRPCSRDSLINIHVEPMYLREARNLSWVHGRPLGPSHAGRVHHLGGAVAGGIASAS
jgi:hypothetical protein